MHGQLIVLPGVAFDAYALVVSESEKGNRLMLEVFSKPIVILKTTVPFNKSEVIAL